ILLVEDDDFAASITAEALAPSFTVIHVENGQAALDQIAKKTPDLVLLDVSMPGLSGYEVCKRLREDSSLDGLPIIFLSGMVSDEERLAGYEAGGDDYLTKPVVMEELRRKIDRTLKNYAERRRLKEDLAGSFSTAMTAMTTAADMGNMLQFLRASYKCQDYMALSKEILNTLESSGMKASVQIRGKHEVVSQGNNGACSALEESVLANMAKQDRLFEFSSCLSCSYEHVTVIVKNVNQKDRDAVGRLRDNLAILVEGADARVEALDAAVELEKEHHALTQLIASTKNALQDIDKRHKQQSLDSKAIFQNLQEEFERRLLTIGITVSQEDELAEMIQSATQRAMALYDEGIATGEHMETILKQLDESTT
ncbi:MAG: response regulator, partial [Gallionellaceae bacterium]|nr:response regulator [Gallionellaceae bacterium]